MNNPATHLPRAKRLTLARVLEIGAHLAIVLAAAKLAGPILIPVSTSFFLGVLSAPIITWLKARGVPRWLAISSALAINLATVATLGLVIFISIQRLTGELPRYRLRLREHGRAMLGWLREHGVRADLEDIFPFLNPDRGFDLVGSALSNVANLLSNTVLVLLVLGFLLVEADLLVSKALYLLSRLPRALAPREAEPLAHAAHEIQLYLRVKALTSLATGALCGVWFAILGVDFALLWGVMAFMLNFVPNVGSFIAVAPAILVALVMHGPGTAIAAATGSFIVNFIIGNIVEPRVMGRALGLSTTVVVVSVIFWGWLLGPMGAILSVPLTMVAKIAMSYTEDMSWVAMLLDDKLPPGAQRSPTGSIAVDIAGPTEPG
jgi:AI-2 transport protein TqsA